MPLTALQRDWGLISRVQSSLTGRTEFVIGGISPYGTIAASEFITQPEYFQQFIDVAPRNWKTKDIQMIIEMRYMWGNDQPMPVRHLHLRYLL